MKTFKTFLESDNYVNDLFGFKSLPDTPPKPKDEKPIAPFSLERITKRLLRNEGILKPAYSPFIGEVRWGNDVGSIRMKISPNFRVIIEQKSNDLNGDHIWVTKKTFGIDVDNYREKEDEVADDIFKEVKKVNEGKTDSPSHDYHELLSLTRFVNSSIKSVNPDLIYVDVKFVNENNQIILFNLAGGGVGDIWKNIKSGPTPLAVVDLSYDKKTGLIHAIYNEISIEEESNQWVIQPPTYEGFHLPSQSKEEITKCISAAMKYG